MFADTHIYKEPNTKTQTQQTLGKDKNGQIKN